MNSREMAILCAVVSSVVAMVVAILAQRQKKSSVDDRRLDLIEKALQHPNLDEATRNELLRALAEPRQPDRAAVATPADQGANWWPKLWFGAGWGMFVVGGCLLLSEAADITRIRDMEVLLISTSVGFAMLTLPAALRELTRRSGPATARR